jgi:hypothetical protein
MGQNLSHIEFKTLVSNIEDVVKIEVIDDSIKPESEPTPANPSEDFMDPDNKGIDQEALETIQRISSEE